MYSALFSASNRPAIGWRKPLTGFEAGIWLTFMCLFGLVITFGLLAFNLPRVRVDGDPTLPYLLAAVGYTGLFGVTIGFVARFIASLEARLRSTKPAMETPDMSVET